MEIAIRPSGSGWDFPSWLEPRLIPDARFARAYDALGDQRRAVLKGLIADHYALNPPAANVCAHSSRQLASGLTIRQGTAPRPFVLLLTDANLDAPALFLAALMPALTSGAGQVLVLRLGAPTGLPDPLLTACELAGQERLAPVNPAQAERLLTECAASGLPGLVLHPDSPELRRVLSRPGLRVQLDASALRLASLRLPTALGLWRDTPAQFSPERLSFLFGALPFAAGGLHGGHRTAQAGGDDGFAAFAAARRDLLLLPDARVAVAATASGQGGSGLVVGESRTGLWTWPELFPEMFQVATRAYTATPEPQA